MKIRTLITGFFALSFVAVVVPTADAQSLDERIRNVQRKRQTEQVAMRINTARRMARQLPTVVHDEITAREAIEWLQVASGVPIVVNWQSLANLGIDERSSVRLITRGLTFERALEVVLSQLSDDGQLLIEPTPWYVEVMTKEQAHRRPVTLVYPIGDLLHEVPQFTEAPEFDLTAVSSAGAGGGGGGGTALFSTSSNEASGMTKAQHAESLADLIRETVEPDIWRANGGLAGSIAVYKENLIVRAPAYVHRQIGGVSPTYSSSGSTRGGAVGAAQPRVPRQPAGQGKGGNALAGRPVPGVAPAAGAIRSKRNLNRPLNINATDTLVPVSATRQTKQTAGSNTRVNASSTAVSPSRTESR